MSFGWLYARTRPIWALPIVCAAACSSSHRTIMVAAPATGTREGGFNLPCPARAPRSPAVGYDAASGLATLVLPKAGGPRTWCIATITTAAQRAMGLGVASTVLWKFTNPPAFADGRAVAATTKSVAATAKSAANTTKSAADTAMSVDTALRSGVYTADAPAFGGLLGDWPRDARQRANVLWLLRSAAALTAGMRTLPRPGLLINVVRARVVVWRLGRAARTEDAGVVVDFVIGSAQIMIASTGRSVLIARTTSNPAAY